MSKELLPDPNKAGWVLGWGVVRNSPWKLHGVYATRAEADAQAAIAGEGFAVKEGTNEKGTDNFLSFS
ncbi:hypothetical protein NPS29_12785 [Pseudomonas putida]|uniref:hypothetical protein n=1 Tax=Pseudomonas putida TaxID=303 RepID=UPI0023641227|nr:hypothetical protein [Pseudomonas putida]MDD1966198.1 hypothetical protein [Pseudomonas putida]